MAQRVGRVIAILFHDRGTRRGWVVSNTPGKGLVPILQGAGWAPGPVWRGGKSRPHRDSIPDRTARSQSLYRMSYLAHSPSDIHSYNSTVVLLKSISFHIYSYFLIYFWIIRNSSILFICCGRVYVLPFIFVYLNNVESVPPFFSIRWHIMLILDVSLFFWLWWSFIFRWDPR